METTDNKIIGTMKLSDTERMRLDARHEGRMEVVEWLERCKKIKIPKYQLKEWGLV